MGRNHFIEQFVAAFAAMEVITMEFLCEETFTLEDEKLKSRNLWYGSAGITAEGEYGTVIKLNDDIRNSLCETIKKDLSKADDAPPTETNWYFYGSGMTVESIGSNILPAIMVRERAGGFVCNISISDHDFCTNLDAVVSFKSDFENYLSHH